MNPLSLAYSNLRHRLVRTLIAFVGIGAVVLLIFMQLGFLDSVGRTATLLYGQLDFDLILISKEYINLNLPSSIARDRLAQAHSAPGVESVQPLTATLGMWSSSDDPRLEDAKPKAHPEWSILLLGTDPSHLKDVFLNPVGRIVESEDQLADFASILSQRNSVLIDRTSRPEYGDVESWKAQPSNKLNGNNVEIVGMVHIGTGFAYSGLLLLSEETMSHVGGWPADRVTFGLIKLSPGANRDQTTESLAKLLPDDVLVLNRGQLNDMEVEFWMSRTAIGRFFLIGMIVALVVGGIFVYQMMAADINKNLPEYATIRALGYRSEFLSRIVYSQGALLALVGYLPGLALSFVGYWFIGTFASVPIAMTGVRIVFVLSLTLGMCLISAAVAVRIVQDANPADLF